MSYGPHVYRLSVWQHVTMTPSRLDNEGIRRLITPLEMRHVIQLVADGRHAFLAFECLQIDFAFIMLRRLLIHAVLY